MVETKLLARINTFCRQIKMTPSEFGFRAIGDPNLLRGLKGGRELRYKTRRRVETFMARRLAKRPAKTIRRRKA